ncbi:helix-turn-helix domain-containing protein [Thalassospira lucentensis]|uniref:TetR/AcrR family transcriptional regulator n=1 Tax=Thalassospira lucentensis TaxID=168935 RepID=UPI002942D820|nr:helix-turn-helix domain-containing protein [Thalassospira lucentensis]WOI11892.1 helix-turn-helix domain-containing protein [Thalassospira lucentensis]
MEKRKYNKTLRAEKEDETRLKIVEAAMSLHGEVGPARTTISAIADRAGVQRLTVYRHFSEENELLDACLLHWLSLSPPPDPTSWRESVPEGDWGLAILSMLYHYYGETAYMWDHCYRDQESVAALHEHMTGFDAYLDMLCVDVLASLPDARRKGKMCKAVARHAVQFATWQSLSQTGVENSEMAALMDDWLHKCPVS